MEYTDAVLLTKTEAWQALDDAQKTSVLQSIEDHEAAAQGREAREVRATELYADNDSVLLGYYSHDERKIYVNSTQFNPRALYGADSGAMVETVLHEGRHAYQNDVVDGAVACGSIAQKAAWSANLAPGGYISFDENPRAYFEQPVEKDARSYAEQGLAQTIALRDGLDQAQQNVATCTEQEGEAELWSRRRCESTGQGVRI